MILLEKKTKNLKENAVYTHTGLLKDSIQGIGDERWALVNESIAQWYCNCTI